MTTSTPISPAGWWSLELPRAAPAVAPSAAGRGLRVTDLVAGDAAGMRELHAATCRRFGAPADTAASFLAIWTMGAVANAVGATWALCDAGVVVDHASLTFLPDDDVPVAAVHLGDVTALVDPSHPWRGAPGVEVVADREERRDLTITALVAAAEPLVDALHRCARVGRAGLWNQVGDGLVDWVAGRAAPADTGSILDAVRELATAAVRRWKATATAWTTSTSRGPALVAQKGGCCLEYRFACAEHLDGDDGAAFLAAFPLSPGERITCGTCCLRDADDAEARQRFWIERRGAR